MCYDRVVDKTFKDGVDYRTANRCVKELTKDGWLRPFTDAKRNCIYDFYKYLDVFK